MKRVLFAVGLAFFLVGSAAAERLDVVVPAPVVLQPLPADAKVQPLSLTRLAANIAPGTPWAEENNSAYFMLPCVGTGTITHWKESNNSITTLASFDRIFRDELRAAGLRSGGDPTNLFEDQKSADLQVGALITGLRIKTCEFVTLVNSSLQGSSAMDVEWQIYSVSQGKVLARITTHGGAVFKAGGRADRSPLLTGAFADNVRRLAADEGFRRIVTGSVPSTPTPPAQMSFAPADAKKVALSVAAKGVVSVFAGEAMGSGVLISPDGYILTNHHVAGQGGQVRVRWPDGSDTVGEVLRGDPRRDIALIKTTPPAGVAPLAIRHIPVELGETVYAIGTPKEREFAGTLTRGVVSTVARRIEGLNYIQSDVAITHGNSGGPLLDEKGWIVGISQSAYEPGGVSQNINFFVPIEEALTALALKPAA